MTWTALLAKWTEFAKSALALSSEGEGGKLRRSVFALIGLQATTHALAELVWLPKSERAVGLDRAAVLIARYTAELNSVWEGGLPSEVRELTSDAEKAWESAQTLISSGFGAGHASPTMGRVIHP